MQFKSISAREALATLNDYVIVDVRPLLKEGTPCIEGASNLPLEVIKRLDVPKDSKLLIYCTAGVRSHAACEELEKLGFTDLTNLTGGIGFWVLDNLPTVPYKSS